MFILDKIFAAAPCKGGSFLGLPTWYHYLPGHTYTDPNTNLTACTPQITSLSDVWLIVAAIIEILLQLSALIAVVFVMYGGFMYITSSGDPNKATQARQTILAAVIGLVIAISAAAVVGYIAGSIS